MNEITIANEFAAVRVSKAGKETYRGALGVITSGNGAERGALAARVVENLIATSNFRALMREVTRVFPVSAIKKSPNVIVDAASKDVYFRTGAEDGAVVMEHYNPANPNKATAHEYARAVLGATATKELKGEKLMFAGILSKMLTDEAARIKALEAATKTTTV